MQATIQAALHGRAGPEVPMPQGREAAGDLVTVAQGAGFRPSWAPHGGGQFQTAAGAGTEGAGRPRPLHALQVQLGGQLGAQVS